MRNFRPSKKGGSWWWTWRYLAQALEHECAKSAAAIGSTKMRRTTPKLHRHPTVPQLMPVPRYPAALHPGARIAVTAPSSGVDATLHARLDLALDHLRAQGFVVEEGNCLRQQQRDASAAAHERAAELMRYLLREDIAAIIPPWGGELAIELLDRLDWPALQGARPKWLLGYSDTSTLLVALTLQLGWATAHGPCLMDLVAGQDDALSAGALAALSLPPCSAFTQRQSTHWQPQWADFSRQPACTYQLTEPTRWRCPNRAAESRVEFGGRLIGGCIDTLVHTAGTPHGDVRRFIAEAGSDGAILYLENAELPPTALVRALHRLRWSGWFDGLAGLMIGRSAAPDPTEPGRLRYADALHELLATLTCPVLAEVDSGHKPPQLLLINGAKASVSWSEPAGGTVTQRLA
jgi:muramoyltetrapeptide carboxypeptidase